MGHIRVFAGGLLALAATATSPQVAQATVVKVISHGKVVAVTTLPKPLGGRVEVKARKMTFTHMQGVGVYTLTGDVHITVIQNGEQVMQIAADEVEMDPTPPTSAPNK